VEIIQEWSLRRSAVRSIAWLGLFVVISVIDDTSDLLIHS
jgi:hypothetical protein